MTDNGRKREIVDRSDLPPKANGSPQNNVPANVPRYSSLNGNSHNQSSHRKVFQSKGRYHNKRRPRHNNTSSRRQPPRSQPGEINSSLQWPSHPQHVAQNHQYQHRHSAPSTNGRHQYNQNNEMNSAPINSNHQNAAGPPLQMNQFSETNPFYHNPNSLNINLPSLNHQVLPQNFSPMHNNPSHFMNNNLRHQLYSNEHQAPSHFI